MYHSLFTCPRREILKHLEILRHVMAQAKSTFRDRWSWPDAAFSSSNLVLVPLYFHISFAQVSDDILNLCIRLFVHLLNLERWTGDSLLFHYPIPVQPKRGPRVVTVIWTRRPKSHRENLHLFDLPLLIVCLGTCRISSRDYFELDPASLDSSFFLFVFICTCYRLPIFSIVHRLVFHFGRMRHASSN